MANKNKRSLEHDNTIIYHKGDKYYIKLNGENVPVTNYNGVYKTEDGRTFVGKHPSMRRIRPNTSPTSEGVFDTREHWKNSTDYEDATNTALIRGNYGDPNWNYAVPYIEDKAIKVRGNNISSNQLDSIAKWAGQTGISLEEALGLGFESVYGTQPYYNQSSALKLVKGAPKLTKEQAKQHDRVMANANYFKNYGIIPAQYLFRDFEYNKGGYNNGQSYNRDIPPMMHAFDYYDRGLYNPNHGGHTEQTKIIGKQVMDEPAVKKWYETSGKTFYKQPVTSANRKHLEELEGIYSKHYKKDSNFAKRKTKSKK